MRHELKHMHTLSDANQTYKDNTLYHPSWSIHAKNCMIATELALSKSSMP